MMTFRRRQAVPISLVAILLVAAALRLPGLDIAPPPLNQDEASRGYDAWSILQTGADRHGRPWPMFLESFGPGDYTAALSTYITIPFVAVLGPTTIAMRLPTALLGIATIGLLYCWMRRAFGSPAALAAAAILAIDPWHVALTRTAHESGYAPFFLAAGLAAIMRSGILPSRDESWVATDSTPHASVGPHFARVWAAVGGFMLAMHAWVYPATRMLTPLLLLAAAIIWRRSIARQLRDRRSRPLPLAFAAGLLIGATPLLSTLVAHPEQLAARAHATVLFYGDAPATTVAASTIRNYFANLDPGYWFLECDEMSGVTIPGIGLHLPATAPLYLIGLFYLARRFRASPIARFLLAWLALYPIPAAICGDWNPHPLRTVGGMLLYPAIAGCGTALLIERAAATPTARSTRGVLFVVAVACLLNASHFANVYFRRFPSHAEPGYHTALVRAIEYCSQHQDEVDFVLVTNRAVQPYIHAMLLDPGGPADRPPMTVVDGPRGFHQVLRFGKFLFAPPDTITTPAAATQWETLWSAVPESAVGFVIEAADRIAPGLPVKTFDSAGDPTSSYAYRVWRWKR